MALDDTKNFCKVSVTGSYTDTDTSITLVSGDGAKLPTPPFNLVWYDETNYPDVVSDPNKEIVRVTAISTDTLTVARGQEGTTAVAHTDGTMINALTKKTVDDINAHITDTSNPHNVTAAQVGAITAVVDDTTPQLGGDLDSNGHIVVNSDSAIDDNLINKLIVGTKIVKLISFDTFDMFNTATGGSGSVTEGLGVVNVRTGTTATSYARFNSNTNIGLRLYSGDWNAYRININYLDDNTVAFAGLANILLDTQTDHTLTDMHAGIFYDNGVFYASSSDGTTQTLTSFTPPAKSVWFKIFNDGTYFNFYFGDTLIAQHPAASIYGYTELWINDKGNGVDDILYCYGMFLKNT